VNDEIRQAIADLNHKRIMYSLSSEEFEDVMYHEMRAAELRLSALIKEQKEVST